MPRGNEIPSNLVPWATDNGSGKAPAQCEYKRDNNDNETPLERLWNVHHSC